MEIHAVPLLPRLPESRLPWRHDATFAEVGERETSAPLSSGDRAPEILLWASFDPRELADKESQPSICNVRCYCKLNAY